MKEYYLPIAAVAAIVVAVIVIAIVGWRSFGPSASRMNQATIAAHVAAKRIYTAKAH